MTEKINTFEELDNNTAQPETVQEPVADTNSGEIEINDFSDTAIGDKVKYTRPNLDGKEDVVDKFQVFKPDTNTEPEVSQNGTSRFWKVNMILSYGSKNEDGVQNREYISGARQFQQRDGGASDISFWYEGAETQAALLWELVAKAVVVEPAEMSPRQFVAFLNSKPSVTIKQMMYKNFGAKEGSPKKIGKNMPGAFTK